MFEERPNFKIRNLHTGRLRSKRKSQFFLKKSLKRNKRAIKYISLGLIAVALTFFVYKYEETALYFKASVIDAPQPFNGTVFPVDKVPDWTHWEGDHYTARFGQIAQADLINLPAYDLEILQFPDDQLIWGNSSHDHIRNAKITYSVVYLGNYKLDHKENVGSHLAVDIRMPQGTPVRAIANGKVIKVSNQESGFGHHIVIMHPGAPDPDNPGKTTTLYSSYVHMDQLFVSEGKNVSKGEVIGTSGNTGTSTTPHLHFQIDKSSAPWYPYWPFTWAEAQEAGLSFFEAVNAGLGLSNARQYTTNPMKYVAKHINYSGVASSDISGGNNNTDSDVNSNGDQTPDDHQESPPENTSTPDNGEENNVVVLDPSEQEDVIDTSLFTFKLVAEKTAFINNGVSVTAIDENNQISQMSDTDVVRVEVSGNAKVSKSAFKKSDFVNNAIKFSVNDSKAEKVNVEVGKSIIQINFIEEVKFVSRLRIDHDEHFQKNIVEVITIVALDEEGNVTPAVNFTGNIQITATEGSATFNPSSLQPSDFKNGVATVRMTSSGEDRIVIRAQNGAIVGVSTPIFIEPDQQFSDVSRSHPNYEAIKYLEANNIINGYSDGSFKPEKTVNRVEALKMLMLAFDVQAGPSKKLNFTDTDDNQWYAPTLATAVDQGIVQGYADGTFKPANTVNKAEYLKILFKTNGIEPNVDVTANPYADVPKDEWYAPYAYLTNKRNLLDVPNNLLAAANGMTRGDVAETIYRMKYITDNNLLSYSK